MEDCFYETLQVSLQIEGQSGGLFCLSKERIRHGDNVQLMDIITYRLFQLLCGREELRLLVARPEGFYLGRSL